MTKFTPNQKYIIAQAPGFTKFAPERYFILKVKENGEHVLASRKAFAEIDFAHTYALDFGAEYDNVDATSGWAVPADLKLPR